MSHFAERLKELRLEADLSMQALADAAKVSKSMICKIERDEVQPTIDVAAKLAHALGKTLSEMLHATQETQVVYLPRTEQAVWQDAQKIVRRNISPVFEGLKIEWLHVSLPAHQILECASFHSKGCEKCILVTKGVLHVAINQKSYAIKKGDSLYFDGTCAHTLMNKGKEVVEYYIIIKHS